MFIWKTSYHTVLVFTSFKQIVYVRDNKQALILYIFISSPELPDSAIDVP